MNPIRILLYHSIGVIHPADDLGIRIETERFRSQMSLLRKGYAVCGLDEAVGFILQRRPAPAGAVVITFDDGYKDNLDTALPILDEAGFKAAFFVTVGYIGSVKTSPRRDWQSWRCMDKSDLGELTRRGHIVGSHGMTHLDMTKLDEDKRREELSRSKEAIALLAGKEAEFFSYPYGLFDDSIAALARDAGYKAACTTVTGPNTDQAGLYSLKRIEITRDDTDESFRRKLESH